jgi:glycogen debranching enzyme
MFRSEFLASVRAAADHMVRAIGPNDLLVSIPAGVMMQGITSWRNIIPDTIIAGEVTEINALSARALNMAAEFTGDSTYADAAERIIHAINTHLWKDDYYLLYRRDGVENPQVTVDALFPIMSGVTEKERTRKILDRLEQPDFWTERGLRTIPNTDPMYDPAAAFGLIGGSWPNPTLWYAVVVAPFDANRALAALERVAKPVVEPQDPSLNINQSEFPEYFHSETGVNLGMKLSPWVAPSVIWAVMEGLLGTTWKHGQPSFQPHWPDGWEEITITNLPTGNGSIDVILRRDQAAEIISR